MGDQARKVAAETPDGGQHCGGCTHLERCKVLFRRRLREDGSCLWPISRWANASDVLEWGWGRRAGP
jgi:hypothetical protein